MYDFFIIRQSVNFFTKNVKASEFFTNFFTNCEISSEEFCENSSEILSVIFMELWNYLYGAEKTDEA